MKNCSEAYGLRIFAIYQPKVCRGLILKNSCYGFQGLLLLFCLCISKGSFAQTPSTNCSSSLAQQLTVSGAECDLSSFTAWDCNTTIGSPAVAGCFGINGVGKDCWGWFTALAGTSITNVEYANNNGDAQVYIYSGTCGSLSLIACADDWVLIPEMVSFSSTPGQNYFVRVVSHSGTMQGSICVWSVPAAPPCNPVPPNDNPCNAIFIPVGAACSFATYTTACATPSLGIPFPGCGSYAGNDVWFKTIVPLSGQITFDSNIGDILDGAMALYDTTHGATCSGGMNLIACDDDNSANGQMPQIAATGLVPGSAVYLRFWENGADNDGTFSLCAYDPNPCASSPSNDNPCGATSLTAGASCNLVYYTNLCATSTAGVPTPSCGFYGGGDIWFKVTVPPSGALLVRTNTGVMTDGGMSIYTAPSCAGPFTELECNDDSGTGLMPTFTSSGLTPGIVIYIRIWSYYNINNGTFRLCVSDPCPGAPANDLPCNATLLPYNSILSGANGCSTNTNDPPSPACFDNPSGALQMNTVWYKFTAVSTCTKIRTYPNSFNDTQMAVYNYSGDCNALGSVIACNDDAQPCGSGGNFYKYSLVQFNSVIGATYYIMVDGTQGLTGSFFIQVIDGGVWGSCINNFPPIAAQDCALPISVCSHTLSIPNPGFSTVGNICDNTPPAICTGGAAGCGPCATTCLCTGERGSSWYKIIIGNVVGTQYLEFTIIPNDYPASFPGDESDYNFAVYGPNPVCSNLVSPLRCHFSPLGVTGVYGTAPGQAPPAYSPSYDQAFVERIPVNSGEIYYINITCSDNIKYGFTLDIAPTTPLLNVVTPGGTLLWTGYTSSDWFDPNNWGGCHVPNCSVSATIPSFAVNDPVINAAGAACRNLDIKNFASLTVNVPYVLNVCGDFTNNGTFTAATSSTVLFLDTSATLNTLHNQVIDGLVTGINKFGNVTVKKPVGWKVISIQDIEMAGNFLVSGAAGFGGEFSAIGKYHKVKGNFTVENSPLTAAYTSGATLEFNGTVQTYLNRGLLNNLLMNQTGAGTLTLQNHGLVGTAWMRINATSTLALTFGKIIAGFGPAATNDNRVEVLNPSNAAVSVGSTSSYIEGTLRRAMMSASGSYDFPVGTSARGYQRINFNVTNALPPTVNYWNIYFDNTAPATNTLLGGECSSSYHSGGLLALNNGFWKVESSPALIGSGIMNVTNYNRNLSWSVGLGSGWTVMYNHSNNNIAANWLLNPYPAFPCANPPVTAVLRNNMDVAALFNGNPVWLGTAQSLNPLPVELIDLKAEPLISSIKVSWVTASEKNNRGFDLERISSGINDFEKIAWLDGHGSTTVNHYYDFEDKNVNERIIYYYRLKQIDYNGDFDYSNTVSARLDAKPFTFMVVPNPYSSFTTIMFHLDQEQEVKLVVYNCLGQKVIVLADGLETEGTHNYYFSAKDYGYVPGIYLVRLLVNGQQYSQRILEIEP